MRPSLPWMGEAPPEGQGHIRCCWKLGDSFRSRRTLMIASQLRFPTPRTMLTWDPHFPQELGASGPPLCGGLGWG